MNTETIDKARSTVPEGFIFYGYGPVKHPSYNTNGDIVGFNGDTWSLYGCYGNSKTVIYALRAGSEIARLNGLEPYPKTESESESESEPRGHPHADLIQQYCEDWKETDEPWKRWEYRCLHWNFWRDLQEHPSWGNVFEYRRKPRTININGFEVPEPVREPLERGQEYFVVEISGEEPVILSWDDDEIDKRLLKYGLIHLTREAAEIHTKALLSFTEQ